MRLQGRLVVSSQEREGGALPAGLLSFFRNRGQASVVGVQGKHHNHRRVVPLSARILLPVVGLSDQIQLSCYLQQDEHQVVPRQPVHRSGWQPQCMLGFVVAGELAHGSSPKGDQQ